MLAKEEVDRINRLLLAKILQSKKKLIWVDLIAKIPQMRGGAKHGKNSEWSYG
jgi:hypothetical protein